MSGMWGKGTDTYALLVTIYNKIADWYTLATTGAGLKVTGAVTTSGTVTEANSGSIKTAVETSAGAVSGGKVLTTETSASAIKTAVEKVATEVSVGSGLKVNGAVTTSGTVTEASGADIKTAVEKVAAEVSVGSGIKVNGAVTTSGTVTEASAASILTALGTLQPVALAQYEAATATGSDSEIVLATQSISSTNGLLVSVETDTRLKFAQATGGATSANGVFKAGTHYIPFTCTHIVHQADASAGCIVVIGKSTA